jgi:hypothetical protein
MKKYKGLWIAGSLICLMGEVVRKLAMFTAKKSFHHIVSRFSLNNLDFSSISLLLGPISTSRRPQACNKRNLQARTAPKLCWLVLLELWNANYPRKSYLLHLLHCRFVGFLSRADLHGRNSFAQLFWRRILKVSTTD